MNNEYESRWLAQAREGVLHARARALRVRLQDQADKRTKDTDAYKRAVADDVGREDALVHARRCESDDEYACLYNRARKCGASHAQASRHADACIHARVSAFQYAEADWSPETQCSPYETSARLERIESLLLAR